jgi:putative hydrolase of the HAD superfamily
VLGRVRGVAVGRLRAVLLDGLGTLLALEPPAPALQAEMRGRLGLELSAEEAEAAMRAEILFYRAHVMEGGDPEGLRELRRRCARSLHRALPDRVRDAVSPEELLPALLAAIRFRAYPEVPDALRALRARGLRLVVVSNWDRSLHEVLAETGLAEHLDGAVTSAETGAAKPAPAVFERGLALAEAAAAEALHAGDGVDDDVRGARAAGIEPVLVWRHPERAPELDPPVRTVRSLAELAEDAA